ncbi:MAG: hypothetical protein ABEJ34_06315 [Haloferacaceae archaeon]
MSAAPETELRRRAPAALVGALATTAAFGVVGGWRGAALGLGVGLVAAFVPAPVGFVFGHLCLGLLSVELTGGRLALLEAGLVPLLLPALLGPLDGRERLVATGGVTVVVAALGAPALWLVPVSGAPWAGVAGLLTVTVAVGGVLWRYEAVRTSGTTPSGGTPDE